MALVMELSAIMGDDTGGFLAAMLQSVQAERRQYAGIGMVENAEDAAFLAKFIARHLIIGKSGVERMAGQDRH